MSRRVATITLNPAYDLVGFTPEIERGEVNLVRTTGLHAAGKGINVAKVLKDLGIDVTVGGFLGKDNQDGFQQLFSELGIANRFQVVQGRTRINVKLTEKDGEVTDFNFSGFEVTPGDWERFVNDSLSWLGQFDMVCVSGSLPSGVSPEAFTDWMTRLRSQCPCIIFDSSREALVAGLKAAPWLVKPNRRELEIWAGRKLPEMKDVIDAAHALREQGISLSWSDIEAAGLMDHPLWKHFDIVFKNFNSATSYSGPAAVRLLRASCGQLSHTNLYQPSGADCYLFENLAKLGFNQQLMLGHNGLFGDFLKELRSLGGMQSPLMDQTGLPVSLQAFDGSPVYEDLAVLNRWLKTEEASSNPRNATFYNTLPLHDGNHFPGQSKTADYKVRAQKLFDDLDNFFTELEKSGRKVMVVVVPEHGGALKGDKMQVSGLRDIPSPSITNVPTAVKFFGMKAPHEGAPIIIDQPSSYLAVSELVVRALDGKMFSEDSVNWQQYVANLPQSAAVSENANAIVIQYQGKPYVQLNGGSWVPYPQ